jgi:hypothetical protein
MHLTFSESDWTKVPVLSSVSYMQSVNEPKQIDV